jgi:hypothetical protein
MRWCKETYDTVLTLTYCTDNAEYWMQWIKLYTHDLQKFYLYYEAHATQFLRYLWLATTYSRCGRQWYDRRRQQPSKPHCHVNHLCSHETLHHCGSQTCKGIPGAAAAPAIQWRPDLNCNVKELGGSVQWFHSMACRSRQRQRGHLLRLQKLRKYDRCILLIKSHLPPLHMTYPTTVT